MAHGHYGRNPRQDENAVGEFAGSRSELAIRLQDQHDLVGVHDIEVPANELSAEVGIGVIGIEQVDLQLELVSLVGEAGDDILIAGRLELTDTETSLKTILSEWSKSTKYETRVSALAGTLVPGTTIHDDGEADTVLALPP